HAADCVPIAEVDIEELALSRPAVAQRVFETTADGPAGTPIGLEDAGRDGIADDGKGAVDLSPRSAAGDVDHRLIPNPGKPAGQPELAAGRHQPTLLHLELVGWVNN